MKVLYALFALALVLGAAGTAEARGYHHGHFHHGGHGGVSIGIGLGFPLFYPAYRAYPAYYDYPPYYPPRVVYAPPPPQVVYAEPAYVDSSILADQASPTFTDSAGQTCREYETTSVVGGASRRVHGTACLQPDGAWRVVN